MTIAIVIAIVIMVTNGTCINKINKDNDSDRKMSRSMNSNRDIEGVAIEARVAVDDH